MYPLNDLRDMAREAIWDECDSPTLPIKYAEEGIARMAVLRIDWVLRVENRCMASMKPPEAREIVKDCACAFLDQVYKRVE